MTKLILILLIVNISLLLAEEPNIYADSLFVKYVFWSSPSYTCLDSKNEKCSPEFYFGRYNKEFKSYFVNGNPEYDLMKKSEHKFILGDVVFSIPAGALFGLYLGDLFAGKVFLKKKEHVAGVLGAASLLCIADISIGISAFKDLKKAAEIRNSRLRINE